jgi:hypothetical protein
VTGFSSSTSILPSISFQQFSISISATRCFCQKNQQTKPGNIPKSNAPSEIGDHWTEKYVHMCSQSPVLPVCRSQCLRAGLDTTLYALRPTLHNRHFAVLPKRSALQLPNSPKQQILSKLNFAFQKIIQRIKILSYPWLF